MSKVLFLCIPSYGHVNPVLGLATELIKWGEEITFFCSNEFKGAIEETGADFKSYMDDLNIFGSNAAFQDGGPAKKKRKPVLGFINAVFQPDKFIDNVLVQLEDLKFDYLVFSAAYPYANVIARVLDIPAVSSLAVFATQKELFNKRTGPNGGSSFIPFKWKIKIIFFFLYRRAFKKVRQSLKEKYHVEISDDMLNVFMNKGDLNIIYTSKYFLSNIEGYDDSFIFVGPPIYNKKYEVDFPFEELQGKRVIYISLGTVFSNYSVEINRIFFESFGGMDAIVVMAAYDVDLSQYEIPANFRVRNFVPQLELLKYTSVAITHAGMNSLGDLLYNNVPFVSIPLGADQFYLANRAAELGATIVLDAKYLNPEILTASVEKVLTDPAYLENIKKISNSFTEAGGYTKAAEEIFKLKKSKGI
jgi:MGT family glycosyltransferase